MSVFAGKHVVFIVENLSVPFDRRVWREAQTLKKENVVVSVICPKGKDYDVLNFEIINEIMIYRYSIPLVQNSKFGYIKEYLKAFIATAYLLIKIQFKKKIDVIHVANPPEIFFPIGWVKRLFNYKFIFDHHDLSPESYLYKFSIKNKQSQFFSLLLLFEKLTYKTSDTIIATNQSIKNICAVRNNIDQNKIYVVRNGPDNNFQPVQPIPELKNNKKYLAAYIGVMGKTDGVENIILAANFLIKNTHTYDIHFILIGYGDEYENHKNLIKKLQLGNFIEMPGRLSDEEVLKILSTADVCLAPDPRNGLNEYHTMNKIMDYMRCGKPIVSFDLDETKISAQDSALYVENNDFVKFAQEIRSICENDYEKIKMGERGKKLVEALRWENSEKILLNAYSDLFMKGQI